MKAAIFLQRLSRRIGCLFAALPLNGLPMASALLLLPALLRLTGAGTALLDGS